MSQEPTILGSLNTLLNINCIVQFGGKSNVLCLYGFADSFIKNMCKIFLLYLYI